LHDNKLKFAYTLLAINLFFFFYAHVCRFILRSHIFMIVSL